MILCWSNGFWTLIQLVHTDITANTRLPPAAPPITGKQTSYQFQVHLLLKKLVTELPIYWTATLPTYRNQTRSQYWSLVWKFCFQSIKVHSQNWITYQWQKILTEIIIWPVFQLNCLLKLSGEVWQQAANFWVDFSFEPLLLTTAHY